MAEYLIMAGGLLGALVGIFHGYLLQKLFINKLIPDLKEQPVRYAPSIVALLGPLLHFSTITWIFGGMAIALSPFFFSESVALTIAIIIGISYLIGAVGNLIGTKGKHPGWIMLAIALGLIVAGYSL